MGREKKRWVRNISPLFKLLVIYCACCYMYMYRGRDLDSDGDEDGEIIDLEARKVREILVTVHC